MEKKRTLKDWGIATRPWSFPASVMPILIMWGFLAYVGKQDIDINWVNAMLCLPLLVLAHAGGNMVSDYYDYTRRVDLENCPNGVTWIYDGTFEAKTILRYGVCLLTMAMVIGLYLLSRSSWTAQWIGIAGMALSVLYPWMKAHALGDVNILISFALLPAIGTAYVATGHYLPEVLFVIMPLGLLTVSILHANNTRDIDNDKRAGLKTLCAAVGLESAKKTYVWELVMPYVLTLGYAILGASPWTALIVMLTLPMAHRNINTMLGAQTEKEHMGIATLDKSSALLQMIFGVLCALGYLIGGWIG